MKGQNRWLVPLMTAGLCVAAPWSVQLGPVPLSAATLMVYLIAGLLPWRQAALAVGLYGIVGVMGVPVFAGFSGGFHRLWGPTGGFVVGYVACALVAAWLMGRCDRRWMPPVALVAGTLLMYVLGTGWYWWQAGGSLWAAVTVCVLPFLIGDGVKIVAACILLPLLKKSLKM